MRICPCGGLVTQHPLTNNREAWTCRSCGRYEIVEIKTPSINSFAILMFARLCLLVRTYKDMYGNKTKRESLAV
jgi:hypothetical protein